MPRNCPACATANPDEARFCMACGAELTATSARAEERRLVTILFADLVGFTERSDHADPEDVRRTLIPFHRAAKEAIEAYGGVLDKFIGDAAMGVFGAPVAHDDDPVRAVRAGLELLSRVSDIQASVDTAASIRVAVNTGEAVVTFGSGPQVGEAVAGDVVNTASRMQSLAPAGGLVIGERSWEATRDVFDAEAAEPVLVKGKSEPLRVWRVLREREAPLAQTPMIGREADLRALREALDAAAGGEGRRIVTVVAEPGSGKTRLLEEFRLRSMADGVTWHEAAFAPYGQQSPFRPLADLVASAAGLGFISTSGFAALGPAIDAAASDLNDASWLRARLAPIFGEDRSTDGTPDTPADTAVAVARLLRSAAGDTLVFALEDVHWAEPSVRAVVRMVADALEGAPALLVCTARPELLEDDDAAPWNVQMLAPLTREDTAAIVIGLVERDALASTVVDAIAERASGNPLFAVEFARGLSSGGADVGSVPTSVRGVIGARLDTLPVAARAVALDASVLGTVFWPSALDALADEPGEVEGAVATLLDRGIVMPREGGPVAGHATFAFRHALLQEEAYGRLARPVRARKHLAAGRWLEGAGSPEAPPPASMVAWHLERALTLAEAAGEEAVAEEARGPAIAWLVRAGDALWRLDPTSAFDLYARAEELGPPDELVDAVLLGVGLSGRRSGRLDSAGVLERYERGLALAREGSDPARIGSWLTRLGSQCGVMGDSARAVACYDEAIALLEPMPPARPLAAALAYRAEEDMMAGRSAASLERVERSLPIAREHEQDDLVIMNLHLRGDARCSLGDLAGVDDLEEALQLARRSAGASDIVTSLTYVGDWMWQLEGCRASMSSFEEGLALAQERGAVSQGRWTEMHLALIYEELGAWDRALDLARALLSIDAGQLDATLAAVAAVTLSTILLRRRGNERAWDPAEVLHAAEGSHELQALAPAYGYAVEAAAARGDTEATVAAIDALLERTADAIVAYRAGEAPCVARSAVAVGAPGPAAALVATLGDPPIPRDRLHRDAAVAALAEAAGDLEAAATRYADVAARWKDYGHAWEEAQAWAGLARVERLREHGTEAAAARARAERIFSELRVPTRG